MPLHPQAQAVIDGVAAMGMPPFETLSLEESRQFTESIRNFMVPAEDVASIEEFGIPGLGGGDIGLRIYRPEAEGHLPAVFYFHGGGFCTGSLDLVDPICRLIANRSGCVVVSVDYHLAPEHPYPTAVTDAYVAMSWVGAYGDNFGVDTSRLAVVGESAGATVATAGCMLIRDKSVGDPEIKVQMLLCPVADLVKFETPSYQEFGEGYLLTTAMMQAWKAHYLRGVEDRVTEPYCSPVREPNLRNLPPAIIITAEYDPLRDEGEAYGQLLLINQVMAEVRREPGMIHNFFWFGGMIDRGREILEEVGADLRKILFIG
ncbi:MAG TPA: alpha/beta hydrolase [Acidimicrobiia bacterium]|nr:alpha/beta hydrolase [Acidimicrobiia bacterium]